jgi:hypothetical protein
MVRYSLRLHLCIEMLAETPTTDEHIPSIALNSFGSFRYASDEEHIQRLLLGSSIGELTQSVHL